MSYTVGQIITEAYSILGVVADGKSPTPTQTVTGLNTLNDNLATQSRDGWALGWYPQTLVTATAPLRDEDVGDVKLALAAWLAPKFGIVIASDPDQMNEGSLSNQIKNAFRRLTKRSLRMTESDLGELSRAQGGPWGGPNWM